MILHFCCLLNNKHILKVKWRRRMPRLEADALTDRFCCAQQAEAGESSSQGERPRDVSCDPSKGAQCVAPPLRWLPVGGGRTGAAPAIRTASWVTDAASCCLNMGTLVSTVSLILRWSIPA